MKWVWLNIVPILYLTYDLFVKQANTILEYSNDGQICFPKKLQFQQVANVIIFDRFQH